MPTTDAADPRIAVSGERGAETEALLQAATALHDEGILTDAEYRAKRRQLVAQL